MYRGADKSLARPGSKQPTATKLLQATQKKIQKFVRPTRSPRQQWPPRRTKKWRTFNCFFSRVGLRIYQHPGRRQERSQGRAVTVCSQVQYITHAVGLAFASLNILKNNRWIGRDLQGCHSVTVLARYVTEMFDAFATQPPLPGSDDCGLSSSTPDTLHSVRELCALSSYYRAFPLLVETCQLP